MVSNTVPPPRPPPHGAVRPIPQPPPPPRREVMDPFLEDAYREVDALTPACPPIAPPRPLDLSTLLPPDAECAEVRPK